MFNSLKSRGLTAGLVSFSCILLMALYGQVGLQDNLRMNKQDSARINELSRQINRLGQTIKGAEVSLYQFLLSLEPADKKPVESHVKQLQALIPIIYQHVMVADHSRMHIKIDRIEYLNRQLVDQVANLLAYDHEQRFPTMRLLFERMNPAIDNFNANIQILESLLQEEDLVIPVVYTRELIQRLKYAWSRSQSNTRLLITSRTGLYGNPGGTMEMLENNGRGYNAELKSLLIELKALVEKASSDLAFADSVQQLSRSLEERLDTLSLMRQALAKSDWRLDKQVLKQDVDPLLHEINDHVASMQQLVSQLAARNLARTEYESEQLSLFLWVVTFFIMALILSTYLVFEHWIRIPIEKVAQAMLLESSQVSNKRLKRINAREIDQLIDAFETMQAQIRQRQQRITSILENAGEAIVLINHQRRIDSFNQSAQRIFGYPPQEAINEYFLKLFDQENDPQVEVMLDNLDDPGRSHDQYLCQGRRQDGSLFPVDLTASPIHLADELCHILVMRDASQRISNEDDLNLARENAETMQRMLSEQVEQLFSSLVELNRTQKQLVESEKMASLAGLVAGVAHEINTPIGIGVTATSHLRGELEEMEKKFKQGELSERSLAEYIDDTHSAVHIIQNNLQRAATLISGFKQVAVDQSSEKIREFQLREYLDEVIMNLQPKLKKTGQQIQNDVDESIVMTSVPGALSQIMTNLVINSLQHAFVAGAPGRICIRAEVVDDNVEMIYQDDGRGMVRDVRDNIFEPFFTTQRGLGGSGLGMHITYNLVTATLKGSIKCVSRPRIGSRFVLRFPLSIKQ